MLGFLFRRLTAEPARGTELFAAVTLEAREAHWYVDGRVPDTLDGRFAMLATIAALTLVRLGQFGEPGNAASVALTERFIEVMESEHRQLGLGDPTLGKKVRKLVGALAVRNEKWRAAVAGEQAWDAVTADTLYKDTADHSALGHSAAALRRFWTRLDRTELAALERGHFA